MRQEELFPEPKPATNSKDVHRPQKDERIGKPVHISQVVERVMSKLVVVPSGSQVVQKKAAEKAQRRLRYWDN